MSQRKAAEAAGYAPNSAGTAGVRLERRQDIREALAAARERLRFFEPPAAPAVPIQPQAPAVQLPAIIPPPVVGDPLSRMSPPGVAVVEAPAPAGDLGERDLAGWRRDLREVAALAKAKGKLDVATRCLELEGKHLGAFAKDNAQAKPEAAPSVVVVMPPGIDDPAEWSRVYEGMAAKRAKPVGLWEGVDDEPASGTSTRPGTAAALPAPLPALDAPTGASSAAAHQAAEVELPAAEAPPGEGAAVLVPATLQGPAVGALAEPGPAAVGPVSGAGVVALPVLAPLLPARPAPEPLSDR